MSFKNRNVIYENLMGGDENNHEETVIDQGSVINQNIHIIKKETRENLHLGHINSYVDKSDNEEEDEGMNVARNSESVFLGIKQEWSGDGNIPTKSFESLDSDDERTEFYIERGTDAEEEDDGEETIAMFVTASGQQLALYAVEDSDDYFAVAVYDESGEPPSNFQFLMKSDVERLIREGAVRTVKKPTQIKKQLVTTQPPVFMAKEEITGDVTRAVSQAETTGHRNVDNRKAKVTSNYVKPIAESSAMSKIVRLDDSGSEDELIEQSTVQYILCDGDQSDAELTFDDIQATLQGLKANNSKPIGKKPLANKPPLERKKTNNGLVYITSPPIRNTSYRGAYYSTKTLKEDLSSPMHQTSIKRSHISNTSIIGSKQNHGIKRELSPASDHCTPNTSTNLSESMLNTNSQFKVKRPRKQQLTSVNRGDSEIIIQPASMLEEEEEAPIPRKKGKRRKKSVPREKILKLPTRKSTRRRRSRVEIIDIDLDEEDFDEISQRKEILEITIDENKEKGSSDKENEVIMVGDSDEEEEESSKTTSLKCKHCSKNFKQRRTLDSHFRVCTKLRGKSNRFSDKRTTTNSDSEGESSKEKNSKERDSRESSKEKNSKPKKEYTCKTCDEKFDMVVTLARHVRAEHSPRKRGRPSKADAKKMKVQMRVEVSRVENDTRQESKVEEIKPQEKNVRKEKVPQETPEEEKEEEFKKKETPENEKALKEKKTPKAVKVSETKRTITSKKKSTSCLNPKQRITENSCINCRRWFSSLSALEIHNLQHQIKKSNTAFKLKKNRRCPICNKLCKSQLSYMKHKKMHAKVEKSLTSKKNRKLQKKQSENEASKVPAIRNRGRPRKLRSNI